VDLSMGGHDYRTWSDSSLSICLWGHAETQFGTGRTFILGGNRNRLADNVGGDSGHAGAS
jgi:hypothetical protein